MHVCHQVDECVPYEKNASQMKEFNDKKELLWMNFIQEKQKSNKTITCFFLKRCNNRKNVYINVYHIKHVTIL
jgi:hypothetical protein